MLQQSIIGWRPIVHDIIQISVCRGPMGHTKSVNGLHVAPGTKHCIVHLEVSARAFSKTPRASSFLQLWQHCQDACYEKLKSIAEIGDMQRPVFTRVTTFSNCHSGTPPFPKKIWGGFSGGGDVRQMAGWCCTTL